MFNEYNEWKSAEYRRNELLREAEHNRLVRQALGAKNDRLPLGWRNVVWQRSFWVRLFKARKAAA